MEKKKYFILLWLCCGLMFRLSFAQDSLALIPKPKLYQIKAGVFHYPPIVEVYASEAFLETADLLREHADLHVDLIHKIKSVKKLPEKGIFLLEATDQDQLAPNAYRLEVDTNKIVILAHQPQALINGISTLRQIALLQEDEAPIPALVIEDEARFAYRGLMLDVSRHFYPIEFVKQYIDWMSLYKLNTFHWHLTDGAGWRLEIKRYPELTRKAAWRTHPTWKEWWNKGRHYLEFGDANASGGYYTQEEAREVVAYAAKRGITVIPEIEMPGHSEEVLAVYPELSCSGIPYKHDAYCVGNPETFVFFKRILDEVLAIFPSTYIHIGGDEVNKSAWKVCPKCQALIKAQQLKGEDGLQSYAIRQIGAYLQEKGRKMIGWDEVLEGGIDPAVTVMSWRGEQGGITAANAGHDVIMTPQAYLYFDSYQTNPIGQPEAFGGLLPLDKVYQYDPVPATISEDKRNHILGLQANVWTEYMPTQEQVEYMVFPRALALSEVGWVASEQKNWADFQKRLQSHYALMQRLHLHYYRPSFGLMISGQYDAERKADTIRISSEQYGPEIRYTVDGSDPNAQATLYVEPFELLNTTKIKAAVFKDTMRMGDIAEFTADIHKAIGKKIVYNHPWSEKYPAKGEHTLVNGNYGGLGYGDGEWQGFQQDFDVTIDFERREELHEVKLQFMQLIGPGVFIPGQVSVSVSDDGKHFRELGQEQNEMPATDPALGFKTFRFDLKGRLARYVRIVAKNDKKAFLFTDEVVVY